MKPILKFLPPSQLSLWPALKAIPKQYVLYGGTAIALQLGHRQSVDFDFFSSQPLNKEKLISELSFLSNATLVHPEINTLNCFINLPNGPVKIQFLAGISNRLARVEKIVICEDNNLQVASLRDLFGTKLQTIQARAEIKDYLDIHALILHGLTLEDGLGCARAIYGPRFDIATSLRALCSFRDGDLPELPENIRHQLQAEAIKVEEVPNIVPINPTIL